MVVALLALIIIYSLLFFSAPSTGTLYFTVLQVVYWSITAIYLYKYRRNNIFGFELFFAISYFLCCFLTLYLLPVMDSYESRSFIEDDGLIYRAYTLSLIGYLCYMMGLVVWKKKIANEKEYPPSFSSTPRKAKTLSNLLCSLFIALLFLNGGARMYTMYSNEEIVSSERLAGFDTFLSFAVISYIVSIVINFASLPDSRRIRSVSFIYSFPLLFIINSIILIGTFLISGYRSNAIQIIIPLILAYQIKFKPLKTSSVLVVLSLGALLMFFIGMTRSGSEFNMGEYTTLTYLRDFKPSNAATTFLINHVDYNGPTGGTNMVFPVLSIVPGLQSFVNNFVSVDLMAPVSSDLFTSAFSSNSGFGTNIIGDLYYSFGFPGVVLLMFLYGTFVCRLSRGKGNYKLVMFLVFAGNAMFAPRVEFCYIIRSIAWSVIFLGIIDILSRAEK